MFYVDYSDDMTVTEQAPEIYPGYPYKRRVFPAWQQMWDRMRDAGEPLEGRELAVRTAKDHDLSPETLAAVLARAAKAGLLEATPVPTPVEVTRKTKDGERTYAFASTRTYMHYRIVR